MTDPQEPPQPADRRRRWLLATLLVLLLAGGLAGFLGKDTSELPVYTTGAARMWAGEEIYRRDDFKPFTYPPFFALPFVPLAWLPEPAQRGVWFALNVLLLAYVLRTLHRAVREAAPGRALAPFWGLVLALSFRHITAVFENQSHDLVILACVTAAADALRRGREPLGGAAAGLGAACKATPLLFAVPFLATLRWRAGLALLAVFAAATLLPDLVLPRADGRSWGMAWYTTFVRSQGVGQAAQGEGAWSAHSYLNQSLSGTLHRLTTRGVDDPARFARDVAVVTLDERTRGAVILAARLLVALLLGWVAFAARRIRHGFALVGVAGATACGMVLLSPMSSKSHFCVLLVPVVHAVATWLFVRRDLLLGILLGVVFALGSLTVKGLVGRELGNAILAHGSVTWVAVCALLAVARALALARDAAREGPAA